MHLVETFIRRPVFALVLSLVIIVLGLRALLSLPLQQYPETQSSTITVTTIDYGASSTEVSGFITTPIEQAMAQIDGVDYITSKSQSGVSTITAYLRLNYNARSALSDISTRVNSIYNRLPSGTQQPAIAIANTASLDSMIIGFHSSQLQPNQITDYVSRVVRPRIETIAGVQEAELIGAQNFALRAWLDPRKLAAYGLTAADVAAALTQNNYISGLGSAQGNMVQVLLSGETGLHSVEEFRQLAIRQAGGAIVRLRDLATVSLGADSYDTQVFYNGKRAVYVGVKLAPDANLLAVLQQIHDALPAIQAALPNGLGANVIYDASTFVRDSLHEVVSALFESLIIVAVVVVIFLGSPRAAIIPLTAIPVSLLGTFMIMLLCGFSINLLTLLALVLAIGLVVDDVIIVVENVNRHLDEGMSPLDAAVKAGRELGGPIIAMTIVLIAVYLPIGFQSGLTGALFTEFAFTLAGAVTLSGVIALTLSPVMCAFLLRTPDAARAPTRLERLGGAFSRWFDRRRDGYEKRLDRSLNYRPVTYTFVVIILGSIYFLYTSCTSELAPQEDQGLIMALTIAAPNATLAQRGLYSAQVFDSIKTLPELHSSFQMDVPGTSITGLVLKPWGERSRGATAIQYALQPEFNRVAGAQVVGFQPPTLPGSTGLPIQFVITSTGSVRDLNTVAQTVLAAAQKTGLFVLLSCDLKIDQPEVLVHFDRNKLAMLGVTMSSVGASLTWILSGAYANYFGLDGRAYSVIPQVAQKFRLTPAALLDYQIRVGNGQLVPLSTIATISAKTAPESINHFNQLNSATLEGVQVPGVSQGEVLQTLRRIAAADLPPGYGIAYGGESRQYVMNSNGFLTVFGFGLIIIYLALTAQFESFRDPLIILISVPMSIAGALLFICIGIGGVSLNIYTEVGLVTLMGLISKHGILIVEFANSLQKDGKTKREAVVQAAAIRLRPIIMTTAAMVLGVVPLIFAAGAGAASRFNMGLVIATGISIGTLFTLFVVPAAYMLIGGVHRPPSPPAIDTTPV
jgi:multidrug efflux pump